MSFAKISKNLDDLERKATKSNNIIAKGDKIGLGDAIKLGQKTNSITSTLKKTIKEYEVIFSFSFKSFRMLIKACSPLRQPTQRARKS